MKANKIKEIVFDENFDKDDFSAGISTLSQTYGLDISSFESFSEDEQKLKLEINKKLLSLITKSGCSMKMVCKMLGISDRTGFSWKETGISSPVINLEDLAFISNGIINSLDMMVADNKIKSFIERENELTGSFAKDFDSIVEISDNLWNILIARIILINKDKVISILTGSEGLQSEAKGGTLQ